MQFLILLKHPNANESDKTKLNQDLFNQKTQLLFLYLIVL